MSEESVEMEGWVPDEALGPGFKVSYRGPLAARVAFGSLPWVKLYICVYIAYLASEIERGGVKLYICVYI